MSKKKNKRNSDTREFTALKQSSCTNNAGKETNCDKKHSEQMRISDRDPKPSFEV